MRYFKIKPEVNEAEGVTGTKLKIGYYSLFNELLCCEAQLTTEQFLRLSDLYRKFKPLKDNDFLEIEDMDYSVVQQKLEGYIKIARGIAVTLPTFVEFVRYVKDLPTQDPRKKEEEKKQLREI